MLNVAPTKSNLLSLKEQLSVAKNGYDLLEQKRELLVQSLMSMVSKVNLLEKNIEETIARAYPAFKNVLITNGSDTLESIAGCVKYEFAVNERKVVVGGMNFSTLDLKVPEKKLFYSLISTDAGTDKVISEFFDLLVLLVEMASIRTIAWRLASEVKKTQRRVNALDKMVIPESEETVKYIENALEEKERENIFVIKSLKRRGEK